MFFTILAACFKSKSSVFVVQSFTLRGEVNKTGRPVLTGFFASSFITDRTNRHLSKRKAQSCFFTYKTRRLR